MTDPNVPKRLAAEPERQTPQGLPPGEPKPSSAPTFAEIAADPDRMGSPLVELWQETLRSAGLGGDLLEAAKAGDTSAAAWLLAEAARCLLTGESLPPPLAEYLGEALERIARPHLKWAQRPITDLAGPLDKMKTRAADLTKVRPVDANKALNLVRPPGQKDARLKLFMDFHMALFVATLESEGWSRFRALALVAHRFNVDEETVRRAVKRIQALENKRRKSAQP